MLWTREARVNGHPLAATRDHLIPRSHGGGRIPGNIVIACRHCNNNRGSNMSWVPYHEHRGDRDLLPRHQRRIAETDIWSATEIRGARR